MKYHLLFEVLSHSIASILVFFTTIILSLYAMTYNQTFYDKYVLSPWRIAHEKKFYLMISSGFLHADIAHLIFNMMTFYFFAFKLEQQVGSFKFLIIYLGSMILADLTTIIKFKDTPSYRSVGASGAISGVLFSIILFLPEMRVGVFFIPFGIPAPIFAVLYLAYCYYAARNSQDNINHDAHLWGALGGVILTIIVEPAVLSHFIHKIFS
ncbi:MAG: rhomboid family intramembrane serine protease [Candidatus Kapabacteria bacterium]|nr:rhomboid family intramembrane serine protease [Candidatus Kapabacteria bacterium]